MSEKITVKIHSPKENISPLQTKTKWIEVFSAENIDYAQLFSRSSKVRALRREEDRQDQLFKGLCWGQAGETAV